MPWSSLLIAGFSAFALTLIATAFVIRGLRRRAILDQPNDRSSHAVPTPRGGGIAVMIALLAVGGGVAYTLPAASIPASGLVGVLLLGAILAAVSWIDDLRTISAFPRLIGQAAAVVLGLALVPSDGLIFQGVLPIWADYAVTAVFWLWFVNLYNFMDGIDGITSIETAAIGGGLIAVCIVSGVALTALLAPMGAAMLGAAAGFYYWNRPPARVFLGDVGSVPVGYVLGWLLIVLAAEGYLGEALLLSLYYSADATITLFKRMARREAVWQAHRSHFYQQAVRALEGEGGQNRTAAHTAIGSAIALTNLALIAAATLGAARSDLQIACIVFGVLAVGALLWYFASRSRSAEPEHEEP